MPKRSKPNHRQQCYCMNNRSVPHFILLLILLFACKDDRLSLVGTWKFVSDQQIDSLENIISRDDNVDGRLIYTSDGDMSVQLIWFSKREPMMSDTVMNSDGVSTGVGPGTNSRTAEQNSTWIDTYDACFGEYEIQEPSKTVTHRISGNLRPERKGKEYKRYYKITGDTLFLKSTNPADKWRTVWIRKW